MDLKAYFDGFTRRDWQVSDSDEGPVRFAMIGLGWWTREQAIPATEAGDLCETTAVVSSSAGKAEEVADAVDTVEAALTYEEFHDGAGTEAYDAIYIATPNARHLEYVETAATLEKAVLCEKPMEASVDRAEALVEAWEGVTAPLMVAYRMHTEPAVRRAKDLLHEGFVGEPTQVHGHMSQRLLEINPNPDQWRLDPEMAGPGTSVTDLGIYPLNTARFLLDTDPVTVQAAMYSGSDNGAFDDVPDERAAFTVAFPDGVFASCTASQNAHQSSHLRIVGLEGELTVEPAFFPDQPRRLTVSRGDVTADCTFDQIDQMTEEFDYFADCVLSGRDPKGDGEHGLVDMHAIEAIYEAAERGERVEL